MVLIMDKEQRIINEINNKYGDKINDINISFIKSSKNFDLHFLQKNIEKYRMILKKIIVEVTEKYEELKYADFIMFNGSFARHSNIFNSDLDLNIMYEDKFRSILLPVELSINYILSKILKFKGCDRVHSIMVYTPLISNNFPKLIDNIKLTYEFGENSYYCRENYEKLLFETCNSSRDYKVLLNYISSYKNKSLEEWETNYELIIDYGKYSDFEKQIINLRNEKIKNISGNILVNNIEDVLKKIYDFKYLNNIEKIYIKDLKDTIKTKPLEIIYKFLTLITAKEKRFIKLEQLYNDNTIPTNLISDIYFYLWILLRIQILFENIGYDLSSHSSDEINIKKLKKNYKNFYNSDIIEDINTSLNRLFNQLKQYLIRYRRELNE